MAWGEVEVGEGEHGPFPHTHMQAAELRAEMDGLGVQGQATGTAAESCRRELKERLTVQIAEPAGALLWTRCLWLAVCVCVCVCVRAHAYVYSVHCTHTCVYLFVLSQSVCACMLPCVLHDWHACAAVC